MLNYYAKLLDEYAEMTDVDISGSTTVCSFSSVLY